MRFFRFSENFRVFVYISFSEVNLTYQPIPNRLFLFWKLWKGHVGDFPKHFSKFLPLSGVGRWACCSCERGRGWLVWAGASDYPRTYHLVTMHMHNPQCTMHSACDPLTYHLVTMHCIICALHDSLCNIVICTMQYPCCFSYVNCLSCPEIH